METIKIKRINDFIKHDLEYIREIREITKAVESGQPFWVGNDEEQRMYRGIDRYAFVFRYEVYDDVWYRGSMIHPDDIAPYLMCEKKRTMAEVKQWAEEEFRKRIFIR